MKQFVTLLLLTTSLTVHCQTAIYKHYASRPHIQAYCVEHYPLIENDTVCVTLFTSGDSVAFLQLRRDLMSLPFTPRNTKPRDVKDNVLPEGVTPEQAEAAARQWMKHKHLITCAADALPGDEGYYAMYFPSDRLVALVFCVRDEKEALSIAHHMTITELN